MVVDSSVWIELLGGTRHAEELRRRLPNRDEIVVPTIVQFELARWAARERDVEYSEFLIAHTMKCRVMQLATPLAVFAAQLGKAHQLAMADAIIYATARWLECRLLTCDVHFAGLEGVDFHDKREHR